MPTPNLLFIYTDEQAFNTLEAYGNTQIEMPNLNRLARQSCVFDSVYVTQPVCTPSRATRRSTARRPPAPSPLAAKPIQPAASSVSHA